MKIICLLGLTITLGILSIPARAQSAEDSVRAAVNALFTAMKDADAGEIRQVFTDSAILQSIVTNKDGKTITQTDAIAEFAKLIGSLGKGAADERIRIDVIKVDGPLAIVWAPYSFYFKGKFSHCGIDSFQLLRSLGAWKIQYLIDTRRKEPCE